jgi:hypothetical protein
MLYGIVMIPSILFVMKFIPETKGRTLEQIEQHWKEEALPEEMKREVKHIAENQMAS